MSVILNGSMFVDGKEIYFEDFEIDEGIDGCENIKEESNFADECDINNYIENCDDCGFCDFHDDITDEEIEDTEKFVEELIQDYTQIMWDEGETHDAISKILRIMLEEIVDSISE